MTTNRIPNGTLVNVRHDLGIEAGMVIGSMNPCPGETQMYTVEFMDRTISTWPAFRVSVHPSETESARFAILEGGKAETDGLR